MTMSGQEFSILGFTENRRPRIMLFDRIGMGMVEVELDERTGTELEECQLTAWVTTRSQKGGER